MVETQHIVPKKFFKHIDGSDAKKSYISKPENGHGDIQLSTLFRIFNGLGKRVAVSIL